MSDIVDAPLRSVSLDRLLAKDSSTTEELLKGAESPGFFFLDLNEPAGKQIQTDLAEVYRVASEYFTLPAEAKQSHFRADIDRGYKSGPCHESFEFARDDFADPNLAFPGVLSAHTELLTRFTADCHNATMRMLEQLSDILGLEGGARLETNHLDNGASDSGLKFISAPTFEKADQYPDTTHTDSGTLTLLWCTEQSSQIQNPLTGEWGWAKQEEGQVLVNVANSLQKQTHGRLHSCRHKVAQPTDGVRDRLMVSYYLRPHNMC